MKMVAGDFGLNTPATFKKAFGGIGRPTHLVVSTGLLSTEKLPLDQLAAATLVKNEDSLAGRATWAAFGAVALGPVGLLAGLVSCRRCAVAVEFKDGRSALLECDTKEAETLLAAVA
jgi:hypothetical protein